MSLDKILELNEKEKITGQIYKIVNLTTRKYYIGQVVSHRKNKGKYRPFGYIGRFNDHISEAINNTKRKQCTYLNNSIRRYGKETFIVKLLENCALDKLDYREKFYIDIHNSLYPNGYNLTKGGKTNKVTNIKNNAVLHQPKKRGRNFGYVHKEETKNKMKKYFKTMPENVKNKKKDTMQTTMTEYYKNKRAKILSKLDIVFEDDFGKYIRPVYNNYEHINYVIRINRIRYSNIKNKHMSLDEKYQMLYEALEEAYHIQQEKQNRDKINKNNKS